MDVLTEDWVSSVERINDGLLAIVEFFSYMAIHPPLHPFLFHLPSPPSSSSSSSSSSSLPSSTSSPSSASIPPKSGPPPPLYARLTVQNNIISNFLKLQSKMTGISADIPGNAVTDTDDTTATATDTAPTASTGIGTDTDTTATAASTSPAALTTAATTTATASSASGGSKGVLSYLLHFLKAFWRSSGGAVQHDYYLDGDAQNSGAVSDMLEYDEDGVPLPTNPDIVTAEQKGGSSTAAVAAEALLKMQADVARAFTSMYVLVHAAYVTTTTPPPSSSSSSSSSSPSTPASSTEAKVPVSTSSAKATANSPSPSPAPSNPPALSAQAVDPRVYIDTLWPLQFVTLDNSDGTRAQEFEKSNIFYSTLQQEGTAMRPNMGKIMSQFNILSQGLPLDVSSSVFVITSSMQVRLLKAMIIGPKDTPYEHGCFEFHCHLPPTFPNVAPQVKIVTTGNGSVRFNPNLYADGKVCLSLLGTWHGSAGESWNPKVSTILQVFVSLQALVFVDEPFFNEPGYESSMGSANGKAQSKAYNDNIRLQNLTWAILNQLERAKSQTSPFHAAILAHLRLKKHEIIATTRLWAGESKSITQSLVQRIEKEIGGL